MITKINGALLEERIITDTCRGNKPTDLIIMEVLDSIEKKVRKAMVGWPKGMDSKIHIAVTVERPWERNHENKTDQKKT